MDHRRFALSLLVAAGILPAAGASAMQHGAAAGSPETKPDALMLMPLMNPERGRKLFASKGCVVCHSVNGVGGEDAPPLDFDNTNGYMNPFDFAARMWAGAEAMIYLQQEELGEQIELTGQELADIIAFAHSPSEQAKFSMADIPSRVRDMMHHRGEDAEEEEGQKHEEDHVEGD
ncbi:MAG TPA: c-type cytochrome [Rhodospirillales bacterium]|nr:c-type cytochrome [Rhodospirillales bacterium]